MSKIKDEEKAIKSLQECIPIVLNNELYFQRCVSFILEEHNFIVKQEHFRKKLMRYFEESFRIDSLRLAYRLIRGQHKECDKESWIWITGVDMALIVVESIHSISCGDMITL